MEKFGAAFQVLFGFVYSKIGIILTGFMIGLTAGALWMTRIMERRNVSLRQFLRIEAALCLLPLVVMGLFRLLSTWKGMTGNVLITDVLFPLVAAAGAFLGGVQFPLANRLYIEQSGRVGHIGGVTYGIDVAGSSLGALLAGSILIPVLGIWNALVLISCLSFFTLVLLLPLTNRS